MLEDLAIDQVGEFVDLASVLLEIKARALVPRPEETEEQVEPIREDLVQRLLEYKQYRDAAASLEDRARQWELRFARLPVEKSSEKGKPPEIVIADAHVWDLVGAMSRVLRKKERRKPRQIVHDDTPIEVYIERVESVVREKGRAAFTEFFEEDMSRSKMVGIFLAVLELVRCGRLVAMQEDLFDEIWLEPVNTPPRVAA